jgi:hypothetical protein
MLRITQQNALCKETAMSDWRKAAVEAVDALEKAADALRQAIGEHDMEEYQLIAALDKLAEEAQEMGLYD